MNVDWKDDELAGGKVPCCPVSDKHHLSASSEPRTYYCRECSEYYTDPGMVKFEGTLNGEPCRGIISTDYAKRFRK